MLNLSYRSVQINKFTNAQSVKQDQLYCWVQE